MTTRLLDGIVTVNSLGDEPASGISSTYQFVSETEKSLPLYISTHSPRPVSGATMTSEM